MCCVQRDWWGIVLAVMADRRLFYGWWVALAFSLIDASGSSFLDVPEVSGSLGASSTTRAAGPVAWVSVALGARVYARVGVRRGVTSIPLNLSYRLRTTFLPVFDAGEPDDTLATARPARAGDIIEGSYLFYGVSILNTSNRRALMDHFLLVFDRETTLTARLSRVPANITALLSLYDITAATGPASDTSGAAPLASAHGASAGAQLTLERAHLPEGRYVLGVSAWDELFPVSGVLPTADSLLPANATTPYRLELSAR